MKYKCIIFDCDGVLVDTEEITSKVLAEMAVARGIPMTVDRLMTDFKGVALNKIVAHFEAVGGRALEDGFVPEFREKTFAAFARELQPIDGIVEVLDGVGVPFCVASSGPRNKIELNLRTVGLLDRFRGNIFSCFDIGKWKPDPAIFERAVAHLGYAPADCLVVEDSISGVTAARRGGFDVCGFSEEGERADYEALGAIFITDIRQVLDVLRGEHPGGNKPEQ